MPRTIVRIIVLGFMILGLLTAAGGGHAGATVHPLVCSENSSAPADTPAQTQDPPGITPGGPDRGQATVAQPVVAINTNATTSDSANAFKAEGC